MPIVRAASDARGWMLIAACMASAIPALAQDRPRLPETMTLLANSPSSGDPALAGQMDGMVQELMSSAAAKRTLASPGARIAYEGVAWRSDRGTEAGTSALGLRLQDAVADALTRRQIPTTPVGIRTRGLTSTFIKGAFGMVGGTAKMVLSLVDQNTGHVVSEVKRTLSPSALVDLGMNQLLPPDTENARFLAQMIEGVVGGGQQPFPIQIRTARGAHAAYFEGDRLQVVVETDRNCFLRLYHVSWAEKTLTMIFPNRSEPNAQVVAGAPIQIPAEGSGAIFEVAKPYGVDAIVAIASETPFADDAQVRARLEAPDASQVSAPVASASLQTAAPTETTTPAPAPAETPAQPQVPTSEPATPPATPPGGDPAQAAPATPSAPADTSLHTAGAFLTESGVNEARTRGVLTRGLIVRHTGAAGTSGSSPGLPPEATAAGGGRVARAACFFTTLPRISFPH